jgi:ATP:ADP antiporter, AAA family
LRSSASTAPFTAAFWRGLLRRVGVDLHPGEGPTAWLLFAAFVLLFNFHYATKSVRQATFIDALGAEKLPYVYFLVALCAFPLLRLYSRITGHFSFSRLVAGTFVTVALSLAGFWRLLATPAAWKAMALYLWLAIVFGLTVSQLWTLASQALDPRQARRLFGFVGAGALLGSILGGQLAWLASRLLNTRDALLIATVPLLGAAALVLWIGHRHPQATAPAAEERDPVIDRRSGLRDLMASRNLQLIAVILTASVGVGQIVDLQFNWAVQSAVSTLDQRTAFFGWLYSVSGIAAFVFQLLLTGRIHRALGVSAAMRIMPVAMGLGTIGLLVVPGLFAPALLPIAFGLKIGENGLRYSVEQSTRELLFLPVPPRVRQRAKAFIDVFVQRLAKGFAALLLLPVTFGLLSAVGAGWIALGLVVLWLLAVSPAHRAYIDSFRAGLRQRRVDPAVPIQISDATTLELLVQSLGSPDPRQVLNGLEVLSNHGRGYLVPPILLHHEDPEVRQSTLRILGEAGRHDAMPLIERQLGAPEPEVRAAAISVLAQLSHCDVGELMLPRLDDNSPEVRAAAVSCLIVHGDGRSQRSALRVLTELMSDADPSIRAEAANALSAVPEPHLAPQLVRLLCDDEPRVVRRALAAVQRRAAAGSQNPLYPTLLVRLLGKRQLKHEAREALVAFGPSIIPTLAHFMDDADESLWVRRALPKAIASIGGSAAQGALLESLPQARDSFLRRKLVQALGQLSERPTRDQVALVDGEMRRELGGYLDTLLDLTALGAPARFRLEGPAVRWSDPDRDPSLLEQLLIEGMKDHLVQAFGLVALTHDPERIWPAYRGLVAARRELRSHALEFLDNTLRPELRRDLFTVIDQLPLAEKLHRAARPDRPRGPEAVLARLLTPEDVEDDRSRNLAAATAYAIYSERREGLYPLLREAAVASPIPLLRETAHWAVGRLQTAGDWVGAS